MAIVNFNALSSQYVQGSQFAFSWAALANGDTGAPLQGGDWQDKTVHIYGTFGAGGSVTIQGSNDPRVISDPSNAVWTTLTDAQANALTKTAAAIETVLENPIWIRPSVTAGDGTTAITVAVNARKVY